MKLSMFKLAKTVSKHSDHPNHQLGAVIVKGNRVISIGFNKTCTHPKSNHPYKRLHAEIAAILKAGRTDLQGACIYVYRENKQGIPSNSMPCASCWSAIQEVGIRQVYYSVDGTFKGSRA